MWNKMLLSAFKIISFVSSLFFSWYLGLSYEEAHAERLKMMTQERYFTEKSIDSAIIRTRD